MADTFTKLLYHLVFSTKHRAPLITPDLRDQVYACMGGILGKQGGVLFVAGGMPDHVHLLAGWGATQSVAGMLHLVKGGSSRWINEQLGGGFAWQAGYGAFSVSPSKTREVRTYILGQEEHHRQMSYEEEIVALLRKHEIPFDPRFLDDGPRPGGDAIR